MGKYTIRLEEVCKYLYNGKDQELADQNFANSWGIPFNTDGDNPFNKEEPTPDEIISNVRSKIFDFTYPLYEGADGEALETKIIKHYYMYEIGFETWGRFKLALNERMNLIMPYFNELYKSIDMQGDNPLVNTDVYETRETSSNGKTSTSSTNEDNATNKSLFEDTPTSELGNTDYATAITTNVQSSNGSYTGNGTSDNNENMERHITGLSAYSKQDMIQRYRENIINVDEAIVNELYDLFMLLY